MDTKPAIRQDVEERIFNLQKLINELQKEAKEHKKTQKDLKNTEKKYQDLYDNAPDMYASVDSKSARILECNKTLAVATGYTKEEIIDKKIFDLYYEDCHIDVEEAFQQFLTKGEVRNKELILQRKDGSKLNVSLNVSSVRDEDGNIIRSRSSWSDISKQKELESELQETISKLKRKSSFEKIIHTISHSVHQSIEPQTVLENTVESLVNNIGGVSKACVFITEGNNAYLRAEHGFPQWYIKEAGLIRKPKCITWKTILENRLISCPNIENDTVIERSAKKLGAKSYISMPVNIDGNTIGAFIMLSDVENGFNSEHEDLLRIVAEQIEVAFSNASKANDLLNSQKQLKNMNENLEHKVRERTEKLKKYAEELKDSNNELEQFAYVASHDLQEPLRKVKSFTELLASKYSGSFDEKGEKYIEYIVDGATRMQRLISDLLSYSGIGKEDHIRSEVDLNQTLKKVIESLELKVKENDAEIINDKLPTLITNENDVFRVLLNLINNALKFRKEATICAINISSVEKDDEFIISVSDNGIGIEQQYLPQIFGIFERLHSRSEYPGTGIGLALCKKIVEKNGGNIWAESEKDVGTTFSFTIPKEQGYDD